MFFSQTTIWSFYYHSEDEWTFEAYFHRFGDIFRIHCKSRSKQMKVRLLLQKLGAVEHKFVDYIISKQMCELSFDNTVKSLIELYSLKSNLFHKTWRCINLNCKEDQYYTTFDSVIN